MSLPRLSLALDGGGLELPGDGPIAVLMPRAGMDLSALPRDRVRVVTPLKPDHDAFAAAGYACTSSLDAPAAAAVVFLPRAKTLARDLLARAEAAVTPGGPVVVDGQKTDGADSILRDLRRLVQVEGPISKAHGKIYWFAADTTLLGWRAPDRLRIAEGFVTAPGVFSADGIDPGSRLLAETVPKGLSGQVADLGAGWGYLAARLLARCPKLTRLDLVEADRVALDCARENVTDPRARFHWADATRWRPDAALDAVVMNPPFHSGRAADPGLGRAFIAQAAAVLRPGGTLWLVANRHLPYEAELDRHFTGIREIGGDARFKLLEARVRNRAPR
ncbi:MAG: class I SAM-dependent methyltransferase [Paracoccaceae bacterium]